MPDTSKQLREHEYVCESIFYAMAKGQDALAVKVLRDELAQAVVEERARVRENLPKIITPTVEPPPNNLSQNQIFASGQMNMLLRVTDLLSSLDKPLNNQD